MKKQILSILPFLVVCQFATAEETQETSGFYGSTFGGAAVFNDGSVDVFGRISGAADFEIETGLSLGLRLGYDFGMLRLEGEYTYASGDIDSLETSTADVNVNSDFTSNGLMLNGLVDFDLDTITLSVGLGLGATNVEYGKMESNGITAVGAVDETVFAYQGILRASYNVSARSAIGLSYRYIVTEEVNSSARVDDGLGALVTRNHDFDSVGVSLFEIFFSYEF